MMMIGKIDERLNSVIRTYPSAQIKVIIESQNDPSLIQSLVKGKYGKFLGHALQYAAVEIEAGLIKDLIKDSQIRKIWYVDSRIFNPYFNTLKGVEYVLSFSGTANLPAVVNMSLGPPIDRPGTYRFNPREPVNVATRTLFEAGIVVVIAVGNSGRMGNNTLNPWSVAPWVIGVGAATKDGKKLADFSSRGIPGDELYKPTLVAPGVDIKSIDDTIVSGTSFACANTSAAAKNIVGFMREHFGFKDLDSGVRTWEFKGRRIAKLDIISEDYKKTIEFEVGTTDSLSPTKIKELLIQCALPMPEYQTHEVGAGFLSAELIIGGFGDYAGKIMPIKIM